ncbi:winged helix-turn-helix domain-containing protein [Gordonia sp. DT219]|uniref:winged helix-turn-helix domain-containing protein n=1 Tax=Gordonia sp. DT219 TaxID=3416658 RepID=UPI003CF12FEE
MTADLGSTQVRRIALAAQGFADRRPTGAVTMRLVDRVIDRTKLFQMDSVNIAVRAHYLPLFSRLGPYDRSLLDRAAWRPGRGGRTLTEYWAHEAALIPVADWPLFGFRMAEYRDGRYRHTRDTMRRNRELAADVRAVIADTGPATPRRIEERLGIERSPRASGGWWNRGEVKHLCEAMFASGEFAATRDDAFGRHYDLAERVVGADLAAVHIDRIEAHRELVARAAAALGVATVADLADYYRLKAADVRPAVTELVEAGVLEPVSVSGWRAGAYLHTGATVPVRASRAGSDRGAILSPFDPLVFFRPRAERVFGFHYRIEIYVPEHKRVHGYYVHPYLLGDDIVARVDLKADRQRGVLRVPGAFAEPGQDAAAVAAPLARDLATFTSWLGMAAIEVGGRGDLAPTLRRLIG